MKGYDITSERMGMAGLEFEAGVKENCESSLTYKDYFIFGSLCVLPGIAPLQKYNFSKNFSRDEVLARTPDTGKRKCFVYILVLLKSWQMRTYQEKQNKIFSLLQFQGLITMVCYPVDI